MPRGDYDRSTIKLRTAKLVEEVMTFFSKLPREELSKTAHDSSAKKVGTDGVLGAATIPLCRRAVLVGLEIKPYTKEELQSALSNFSAKTQSILKAERKNKVPKNDTEAMALWKERGTSKVLTNIRNNHAEPDVRIAPAPMHSSVISELRENYIPKLVIYNVAKLSLERDSVESNNWSVKVTRVVEESFPL